MKPLWYSTTSPKLQGMISWYLRMNRELAKCVVGEDPTSFPVFGVRSRFHGVKRRKPLHVTFFNHLRGSESCGDFFCGSRPLTDSVCAQTFLYLCPVLKPVQMQDSSAQTNWASTNAGLTHTNGHSVPNLAMSTHNYAPMTGRILQTRGLGTRSTLALDCIFFFNDCCGWFHVHRRIKLWPLVMVVGPPWSHATY